MRLHVFQTGRIPVTGAPVLTYLIQADGANILVDSGYPRDRVGAYRNDPTEFVAVDPGQDILSRLTEAGVAPDEVHQVICSHFDPDHAGNHDAFPGAELIVQAAHYEWARSGSAPRLGITRAVWDRPSTRLRLVHGDTALLPGVDLLLSPGHVPGHQSVLVRLPETGPVLLAVDAIPMAAATDPEARPIFPFDLDEADTRASTKRLMALAADEGARVIFGHQGEAGTLR